MATLSIQDLLDVEHRGWRSLTDGTAAEVYDTILTDEAELILAHGEVLPRAEGLAAMGAGERWAGYRIEQPHVVPLGDDAAVLVYTGCAHRGGPEFRAHMASTYVLVDGQLKLAVYQQTPIPQG